MRLRCRAVAVVLSDRTFLVVYVDLGAALAGHAAGVLHGLFPGGIHRRSLLVALADHRPPAVGPTLDVHGPFSPHGRSSLDSFPLVRTSLCHRQLPASRLWVETIRSTRARSSLESSKFAFPMVSFPPEETFSTTHCLARAGSAPSSDLMPSDEAEEIRGGLVGRH